MREGTELVVNRRRPSARRSLFGASLSWSLAFGALAVTPGPALAATFTVNRIGNQADLNLANAACDVSTNSGSQCTLRAAIQEANDTPGADTIRFNITSTSKVIAPTSPLPTITEAVVIDGYSQPGASANTLSTGNDAVLKIILDGVNAGTASGLVLSSAVADVVIKGLVIQRFAGNGITVGGHDNRIRGNFIGTNAGGSAKRGNSVGVAVTGDHNVIGGVAPADRNLISGNRGRGVFVNGLGAYDNGIFGNYIGTTRSATAALGNGLHGVEISSEATRTTIGLVVDEGGNVISGNGGNGVETAGTLTRVQGNLIGTNAAGTGAIGNGGQGVRALGGEIEIGAHQLASRNVISGNRADGIHVAFVSGGVSIIGNFIGTNAAGTAGVGNGRHGVYANTSALVSIGDAAEGIGNVISANAGDGINVNAVSTLTVNRNKIGTNAAGTAALANAGDGINLRQSQVAEIGGTDQADDGNVISANLGDGIEIIDGDGPIIAGNVIGTNSSGVDLGNGGVGVLILGSSEGVDVGGSTADARNVISFNVIGIFIFSTGDDHDIVNNEISRNDTDGVADSTGDNDIVLNTINGNGGAGVSVPNGNGVRITQNNISANGGLGIDLVGGSEDAFGVTANDAGDADTGPNGLQNFPVITSALRPSGAIETTVTVRHDSLPNHNFRIELFVAAVDASNYGEGVTFRQSRDVLTGADGSAITTFTLALAPVGQYLTATATDRSDGSTSEFALVKRVTQR